MYCWWVTHYSSWFSSLIFALMMVDEGESGIIFSCLSINVFFVYIQPVYSCMYNYWNYWLTKIAEGMKLRFFISLCIKLFYITYFSIFYDSSVLNAWELEKLLHRIILNMCFILKYYYWLRYWTFGSVCLKFSANELGKMRKESWQACNFTTLSWIIW